ncbi:putative nicotinate phosphoribosyltransferase [Aeromonas phage LAh_8]|uniref:Putative nicotinate phosphoribosyltransferase n=1 Tax=Aeromonas phage LAh_8 TaxID=2591032 RepID=A0A514A0J7_9CAUD|nr:nicotinamide phosphoribosyl transferase [Aeromonas phage LAh_8]QDH46808.1 putative nicotinate phosphoribosyltransferase [Aeromonas phage LAh_8]
MGIGSYTYNYLTRDSAGMAIKATYAEVNGKPVVLSKDPVTDDGTKKSAKGLIRVERQNGTFVQFDEQTSEQEKVGALETILFNGAQFNLKTWDTIIETANA